jgi:hypothetical protein
LARRRACLVLATLWGPRTGAMQTGLAQRSLVLFQKEVFLAGGLFSSITSIT